ncbi:hypothetical protein QCA50_000146 [Cerrena zonata]|uniref:Uncharacterized protein n=1 Tax=Cerrena zonata TaxID=2478898 RepID=A0AAW0GWB2_9APHY
MGGIHPPAHPRVLRLYLGFHRVAIRNNGVPSRPDIEQVAKALGLISVFSALSSIVVGVYFVWRHHRPPPSKSTMAYIHKARNNPLGLTGHAILLSLPATFLYNTPVPEAYPYGL